MTQSPKVALITGSARRIGAAIATHLHQRGYSLALHAHRSTAALDTLAASLDANRPGSIATFTADLRTPSAPASLIAQCLQHFGRLDGLINNASSFYPTTLQTASPTQWDELFTVNARAPFLLMQAAAAALRRQHGAIVNITDLHAHRPLRDHGLYCASKAALEMLSRSMALELAPEVRVNAIAPGAILWPEQGKSAAAQAELLARTPLGRTGGSEEIAAAVYWLLNEAEFITGQTIHIDGGRTLL